MKKVLPLFVSVFTFLFLFNGLFAQTADKDKVFGVSFSGYVKNDFYYDTRQVVSAREGHLLMWPTSPLLDPNGVDINDHGSFHFLAIQTRLTAKISGPDALGAKTSGMFEGEFFGHSDADINGFRLRHAIIKLNWEKAELMTGQFWHPMFVLECFPGTVSFNTGIGFQPFSRNPQIRYSYKVGNIKIAATAFGERDFTSRNIAGIASTNYIRFAEMPAVNFHFNYGVADKEKETAFNTGFTVNYKTIQPSLTTATGFVTDQKVSSLSGSFYLNKKFKPLNIKLSAVYSENGCEMFIPGGYAVLDTVNTATADVSYIPTRTAAGWIDISTTGKVWQFGVFAGYNKNFGAAKEIIGNPGGLATNIEHLYRVSPRVNYFAGKFQVGAEVEYTVAGYGDGTYDANGIPLNAEEVANLRFLLGVYYHF
jgi:hypothetical protein